MALSASTAVRAKTIAAPPTRLWELVSDPHHQPRWWPGVERVEGVDAARFTQVMRTRRGRPVRIDFRVVRSEPPTVLVWRQEIAGTPFARVLERSLITLALEPAGAGTTTVTVTQDQKLRGASRGGGLMVRRATGRRLAQALAGLAAVSEASTDP